MITKRLFTKSCLLMAIGIILGAFAAHGLKEKISADKLVIFETGVKYHLLHALALIVLALNAHHFIEKRFNIAIVLIILGILFFSGSIYALATIEINGLLSIKSVLGPITPIGGLCFISGWVLLAFSKKKLNE